MKGEEVKEEKKEANKQEEEVMEKIRGGKERKREEIMRKNGRDVKRRR